MNTKYNFYSTLGAALLLLSLTASAESKPIASAEKKEKKEKAEKKEKKETAGSSPSARITWLHPQVSLPITSCELLIQS